MTEEKKWGGGKKHLLRKVLQGLLIGTVAGIIAILSGFLSFSRNLELMTLDLRYRLRPQVETLPEVGFLDYDDTSLELFGEWPWPRMRQVALVKTLDFYDARMAGYDVFFLEKENTIFYPDRLKKFLPQASGNSKTVPRHLIDSSFRNYDREFADALKHSNRIYLAYFAADPDERIAAKGLSGILEETGKTRKKFSALKKASAQELEKTFLEAPKGVDKYLYKTTDIDPPLPELTRSSKGVGFAQPGIDEDSVKRNYMFFRYYNKQMLYSITLKMLSEIMDFKLSETEIYPGKYMVLKNALDYKTKQRKDIKIPIDDHCQILLNTAGSFHDTFFHVPFRLVSYYYAYNIAKEIVRQQGPMAGDRFPVLRDNILSGIMEEGMVTGEETERISKEIAAAYIITRLSDAKIPSDEILRRLKGHLEDGTLKNVFAVVSAAREMEKALKSAPTLTFEQWQQTGQAKQGTVPDLRTERSRVVESGLSPTRLDESHLREVFRNVKSFAGRDRLKEISPYYFPPVRKIMINGKLQDFSPVDLKDKIFMIGLTGTGTIDLKPIPFEEDCPLVALHVNALNTVLTQKFLHFPPENYKYAAAIIFSLLIGVTGVLFSIPVSFLVVLITTGGYFFTTYKIWEIKGLWLDWVVPVFGIIFSYMTIIVLQYIKAFREKKKVRGIFSTMVSPAVLKVMEESPDKFSLTGERKPATTCFSMINGMGNVTKSVAPDELTNLLSIYLTPNSEIIMDYDGYIDKYEGHVIMADFGVPLDDYDNPWKCAFACIEQKMDIESFKYFVASRYGLKVGVSMGFNYGYVSAGNMGSERKFQYTVMGDPVNVAARFMASNFIYNANYSITGEDTVPVISEYAYLRALDKILLKGKTKPTAIFNVLGWKPEAYMKLRGSRPVPEFLVSLWSKCPPEKIFGYYRLWSGKSLQTGHPMAEEIRKFFGTSLDLAQVLLLNGWKKEIAVYSSKVESLKADVMKNLNRTVDFVQIKDGKDFREVLDNWKTNIRIALEIVSGAELQDNSDRTIELFLEQVAHEGNILLNKIEILRNRLDQKAGFDPATDERLEDSMKEIRNFIIAADRTPMEQLEHIMSGDLKKYQDSVAGFYKSIKDKRKEYHEMMSLAGAPASDELTMGSHFEKGLALYWQREWDAALEEFRNAERLCPGEGAAVSLIERTESYKITPPGENWQGEFVQTKK